ncbi:MAG: hypothetical protein QXF24_02240 [Thermoproteota archaeon]
MRRAKRNSLAWRITFPLRFAAACFLALIWLLGLSLGLWDV